MSNLPSYPTTTTTPPETAGPRPRILDLAFWLYLASIVVGAIASAVGIPSIGASTAAAQRQLGAAGTQVPLGALMGIAIGVAVVGAVIGVALWVLFLIFLRLDRGWARWVLAALTVLSLTSIVSAYGLGALHEVLAIVAAVLTFLPAATAFFREAAERRRARRSAAA